MSMPEAPQTDATPTDVRHVAPVTHDPDPAEHHDAGGGISKTQVIRAFAVFAILGAIVVFWMSNRHPHAAVAAAPSIPTSYKLAPTQSVPTSEAASASTGQSTRLTADGSFGTDGKKIVGTIDGDDPEAKPHVFGATTHAGDATPSPGPSPTTGNGSTDGQVQPTSPPTPSEAELAAAERRRIVLEGELSRLRDGIQADNDAAKARRQLYSSALTSSGDVADKAEHFASHLANGTGSSSASSGGSGEVAAIPNAADAANDLDAARARVTAITSRLNATNAAFATGSTTAAAAATSRQAAGVAATTPAAVESPSAFGLAPDDFLQAVMRGGLDSTVSGGTVVVQLRDPLTDIDSGLVLAPAVTTTIVGDVVATGSGRTDVRWREIRIPGRAPMSLLDASTADAGGSGGIGGQVDDHRSRLRNTSFLYGALAGLGAALFPPSAIIASGSTAVVVPNIVSSTLSGGAGGALQQLNRESDAEQSKAPTVRVRAGTHLAIQVRHFIPLEPYCDPAHPDSRECRLVSVLRNRA